MENTNKNPELQTEKTTAREELKKLIFDFIDKFQTSSNLLSLMIEGLLSLQEASNASSVYCEISGMKQWHDSEFEKLQNMILEIDYQFGQLPSAEREEKYAGFIGSLDHFIHQGIRREEDGFIIEGRPENDELIIRRNKTDKKYICNKKYKSNKK